jgi:putative hydroxymethylpyrimidine transport system ATP-binding protein
MKPSGGQIAPSIALRDAHLAFEGEPLFEDLALDLPAGEITCLLGPSGVGKSSLLRLIAGLAEGAGGRVEDGGGRSLTGRVAYMAQQDLLLPWLKVRDNLLFGPRLRGEAVTQALRDRAAGLLARVGLEGRSEALPQTLSGGMRQRCALARTLMEERPVVLMDEPFSAVDAITRHELQDLAAGLLAGRTVFLVTHDPAEALRLGHRIHVMAGRPARLDEALLPPGAPPRPLGDPACTGLLAELMARLSSAKRAVNRSGGQEAAE